MCVFVCVCVSVNACVYACERERCVWLTGHFASSISLGTVKPDAGISLARGMADLLLYLQADIRLHHLFSSTLSFSVFPSHSVSLGFLELSRDAAPPQSHLPMPTDRKSVV